MSDCPVHGVFCRPSPTIMCDRLAGDLRDEGVGKGWAGDLADRLIALGWVRLDEATTTAHWQQGYRDGWNDAIIRALREEAR